MLTTARRSLVPAIVLFGLTLAAAAPAVAAKPKPLVKITNGPLAITTKIEAEFRLKTSAKARMCPAGATRCRFASARRA